MTSFNTNPGRKNNNQNLPVIIALAAGLLCLIIALVFLLAKDTNQVAQVKEVASSQVLISIAPIEAGTELTAALFRVENKPVSLVGEEYIKDLEQIKGSYASSYIAGGTPLHSAYITTKRPINQIQANIPDGYRAVTLGVDPTTSVEGWARPGAKVDVLLSSQVAGKPTIRVIVQNAKVLSAGMQSGNQAHDLSKTLPSTVTLLVTSDEAGKIQLASSSGTLSLILRGDEDTVESEDSLTVNIDTILGREDLANANPIGVQGQVKVGDKKYQIIDGQLKEME